MIVDSPGISKDWETFGGEPDGIEQTLTACDFQRIQPSR